MTSTTYQTRFEQPPRHPFIPPHTLFPQQRSLQQIHPSIWQPILSIDPPQANPIKQNLSASSLNVHQLNQDLVKLKEQLKKLAERGEEMGVNRVKAQEALSARPRLQSSVQQVPQVRTNLSSDHYQQRRKDTSSDLIFYPSTTSHPNQPFNFAGKTESLVKTTNEQITLPSRQRMESDTKRREDKGKIFPLMNPNKRGGLFKVSHDNNEQKVKLSSELKELKQKVSKLEHNLQISNLQKQNLALQIKSLTRANEELKGALSKDRETRTKSMILESALPLYDREREQKQTNFIIQKLQAELAYFKSNAAGRASFDDALKSQLEENKLLKLRLDECTEEVQQLNDQLTVAQKYNENLRNQMTLLQMKTTSELRAMEKKLQIQLSDKSNELQTARRALETLDLKYRTSIQEIKEKDSFIMNYLVGRSKDADKEDIKSILQQYQITFPTNRVMEDLLRQQHQIEALKTELKRLASSQ